MQEHEAVLTLLRRIEANQVKALQAHERQLDFTKAQLEASARAIDESIGLQRVAVARQVQVHNAALPLIVVLLLLLGYLLVKWRVFL